MARKNAIQRNCVSDGSHHRWVEAVSTWDEVVVMAVVNRPASGDSRRPIANPCEVAGSGSMDVGPVGSSNRHGTWRIPYPSPVWDRLRYGTLAPGPARRNHSDYR